jgi:hypothetical protein
MPFGYFSDRKLAVEKLHLDLGVVSPNMVRGSSAPHTKPFLKLWIPADFWMFHRERFISWKTATGLSRRDIAAIRMSEVTVFFCLFCYWAPA